VNGYKLLGYVVWRAGKWYLRRRLPSRRLALGAGLGLLAAGAGAAALARRAAG
jgi:hypothetical protein